MPAPRQHGGQKLAMQLDMLMAVLRKARSFPFIRTAVPEIKCCCQLANDTNAVGNGQQLDLYLGTEMNDSWATRGIP